MTRKRHNESKLIPNPPNALRALRVRRNVSAATVAAETDNHKEAIIRLERFGTGIGEEGRKRLALYYGVDVWDLNNLNLSRSIAEELEKNLPAVVIN